ncbi:MAG: hydroxyethylthiazole kinase, partial [Pseudomonadota bacterium]
MSDYQSRAEHALKRIRETSPVVHSITNYVVMNSTANALLALGASPIMAHAPEEIGELVNIASAVVTNIGTLSREWIESMVQAARECAGRGKPFVLDPVGSGATAFRTAAALRIIETATPTVIRGNASEVLSLSSEGGFTRGVDSVHTVD